MIDGELTSTARTRLLLTNTISVIGTALLAVAGACFITASILNIIVFPTYFLFVGSVLLIISSLTTYAFQQRRQRRVAAFSWDDYQLFFRCYGSSKLCRIVIAEIIEIDPRSVEIPTDFVIRLQKLRSANFSRTDLRNAEILFEQLDEQWIAHRAIQQLPTHREIEYSEPAAPFRIWRHCLSRNASLLFVTVMFTLVTIIFSAGSYLLLFQELPYAIDAERVQGTIIQFGQIQAAVIEQGFLLAHGGGRKHPRTLVNYEFITSDGRKFAGNSWVDAAEAADWRVGQPIEVEYVGYSPQQNRATKSIEKAYLFSLIIVGVSVLLVTIVTGLWRLVIKTISLETRLFQTGRPVWGKIQRIEIVIGKKSAHSLIHYLYELPDDSMGSNPVLSEGTIQKSLTEANRLRSGDSVLILYDAENPKQHIVDLERFRLKTLRT